MRIDRKQLVTRHDPRITRADRFAPLSVGNGEFAFTADVTGLQSFPDYYQDGIPLCTQAQWGWHTAPFSADQFRFDRSRLRLTPYDFGGRSLAYPTSAIGQENAYRWLRENPHRLHLGRIGLCLLLPDGRAAVIEDLADINQRLDLWAGILESRFTLAGSEVLVKTACHPRWDAVSCSIESDLIRSGRLSVIIAFPYGSSLPAAADWAATDRHATEIRSRTDSETQLQRILDQDHYCASVRHPYARLERQGEGHVFSVRPMPASVGDARRLEVTVLFTVDAPRCAVPSFEETADASRSSWSDFWSRGGALDLAGSDDERAGELERRIVLSQYLTAIQCAGSLPPQETGLTCNSWYGKFHLEMHWWHAAHFILWDRTELAEKSLAWYREILPRATQAAAAAGFRGARWPKMTSGEGEESPSLINPLIIWQQPHPIFLAELIYRGRSTMETLERYRDLVFASADFMASFVVFDQTRALYCLVPPIIPAQENHRPEDTLNPCFEIEYWLYGLRTALAWRKRLGLAPDPHWEKVCDVLAPAPVINGLYAAHERCADTFGQFNSDHPSFLAACGMLPGLRINRAIMTRTLEKTLSEWRMDKIWGWDFPLIAMTAARLGKPETAVDALFIQSPQNVYLPNGHNRQAPDSGLPLYLPGNGGLLAAIAMMTAGWDGSDRSAPGFPDNGKWRVAWENLKPMP
jgi:hypothetical protein